MTRSTGRPPRRPVRIGRAPRRTLAWVPTDPVAPSQWNTKAGARVRLLAAGPGVRRRSRDGRGRRRRHRRAEPRPRASRRHLGRRRRSTSPTARRRSCTAPPSRASSPRAPTTASGSPGSTSRCASSTCGSSARRHDRSARRRPAASRRPSMPARKVINLSLGGRRAPGTNDDEYSRAEQDAIDYAYAKGAVIVAATGNSDTTPYRVRELPGGAAPRARRLRGRPGHAHAALLEPRRRLQRPRRARASRS